MQRSYSHNLRVPISWRRNEQAETLFGNSCNACVPVVGWRLQSEKGGRAGSSAEVIERESTGSFRRGSAMDRRNRGGGIRRQQQRFAAIVSVEGWKTAEYRFHCRKQQLCR